MLVKSYNHLHLVGDVDSTFTNQDVDKDYGLDIFQMFGNNIEIVKEIITRELLDFKRFHVDMKDIKNLVQWWEKHESKFPTISFLAKQILRIIGSQIETKQFFSFVAILTNLRRC
jgi:hypothetical protein